MNRDVLFGIKLVFISGLLAGLNQLGLFNPVFRSFFDPLAVFFGRQSEITGVSLRSILANLSSLPQLSQNLSLKEQKTLDLEGELSKLAEVEYENNVLREELGFLKSLNLESNILAAEVVGEYQYPQGDYYFVINKGGVHGVAAGQHVLYKNFLLGTVSSVSSKSAKVDFILDRDFHTSCLDQDSVERVEGICQLNFERSMVFGNLPPGQEVSVGDKIITSGKDGQYPRGFLLGEISRVIGGANDLKREAIINAYFGTVPSIVFVGL